MAGKQQAAGSRRGLQPHHVGRAHGQNQQAKLSKYLQACPGQRWFLHGGGDLADSVKTDGCPPSGKETSLSSH